MKYISEAFRAFLSLSWAGLALYGDFPRLGEHAHYAVALCGMISGYHLAAMIYMLKIRRIHRSYEGLLSLKEIEDEFMKKVFEEDSGIPSGDEDQDDGKKRN